MKTAVVLFNLGGPDAPAAVAPFLFNLFHDPAIINLPQPLRWIVARLISSRRAPVATEIYGYMGGRSPILPETEAQARALEAALAGEDGEYKAFIAMRYWHPFAPETARAVKAWGADRVILLPLYPQFSTTTTGSSLTDWRKAAAKVGLDRPTSAVGCYFDDVDFIVAHIEMIRERLAGLENTRLLFSAHGLPEKIVRAGDPYQWQVEGTVAAIMAGLDREVDHVICYQSRVGPMAWIGPSTEAEVIRAGRDGRTVVLVPIAFVSEHSETLVELDVEYRRLGERAGVAAYHRLPALGVRPAFIKSLAGLVRRACQHTDGTVMPGASRQCPPDFGRCICGRTQNA
jgi:ferrochelatase